MRDEVLIDESNGTRKADEGGMLEQGHTLGDSFNGTLQVPVGFL